MILAEPSSGIQSRHQLMNNKPAEPSSGLQSRHQLMNNIPAEPSSGKEFRMNSESVRGSKVGTN